MTSIRKKLEHFVGLFVFVTVILTLSACDITTPAEDSKSQTVAVRATPTELRELIKEEIGRAHV